MKKRLVTSALFALSLAACSAPEVQTNDSSGNPNALEEVNTLDNTPPAMDQNLQANALA